MSETPKEPFVVPCPCCQAKLRVDPELQAVLSYELPPEERRFKDLSDGLKGLKEEQEQRQAKFQESLNAQKTMKDLLEKKFHDALKKAKNEPITKPVRDIDLE